MLFRIFFNFKVYGKENVPLKGGFVLVSNHQSFLDPILNGLFLDREMYYLARRSLFGNKFFKMLSFSLNAMSVERGAADVRAMREVIAALKQGRGIVLYPEATRTDDGRIRDFKAGAAILAKRANVCIVPALVDGAFECWPRKKKIFSVGKKIVVYYGQCITAQQAEKMDSRQLAKYLTERVRQMQSQLRIEQGKKPFDYESIQKERDNR